MYGCRYMVAPISLCMSVALLAALADSRYWHNGRQKALHRDTVILICAVSRTAKCVQEVLLKSSMNVAGWRNKSQASLHSIEEDLKRFKGLLDRPSGRLLD
ncbi:hypothetical protein TRVL_09821 [Trypanosoma vivax]|nr:hypothetical protein TRVL_09821 [Trypanosoma vivax]